MIGPRHPQSTRPMKLGKPPSKGNCATRAELEAEVARRWESGWKVYRISVRYKVCWENVKNIINKLERDA